MRLPDRPLRLVLVLAMIISVSALMPSAGAAAGPPFAVGYDDVVYGDFLYAGNGVLRCPLAADHAPTAGPVDTPAACANTADRKDTLVNDDFFMQWADVDADPGTFDSASASVRIPPGARIVFARLNWAGNTTGKTCGFREGVPAIPPPGNPATQNVRLSVGSAKPVDVAPAAFAEDGPYYSAHADVTSRFAGAPTGAPLDVTVGNVWAPKGFDCVGGWSIALVYAYPERNPDFAPNKRKVVIDDGHVHQDVGAPTETTITGFRAAAADAHIGVTAYDGDWGGSGDQFLIDGTPAAEPATGGTSNFFISNADNAAAPGVKNNFSVDAKSFNVDTVPAGATSTKLGFVTSGDTYLAQNLAFSVPVPELQVGLRPARPKAHAGEPLAFAVAVTNPGSVPATGVQAADEAVPACAKALGTLAPHQTVTYDCTGPAPADDFTNTVKATGTSTLGDALDGTASAAVDVVHPALGMTKTADKPAYRAGDTATFTIKVTNTGDTGLSGLRVTDPKAPACALAGALAPGESRTTTCAVKAPIADGVNTATATATDELGQQVTATADAPAPTISPAIQVTKTADPPVIHAGDAVTFSVAVKNTGDSPLAPVRVTDDTTTSCSRTFDRLAPGATQTYTCTANPSTTKTSQVIATGTDSSGQPVAATASATVTVITPALTLTKDASPAVVRAGDPVTFTITVANAGDAPLTDVAVTDDRTPACAKAIGALPPQGRQTYTCTAPAPPDDFTNTAAASGKDQLGRTVKVTGDAVVDVIHPAVALAAQASPAAVREGDLVTWTITASNTGDVPLTGVAVADDQVAGCAKPLGTLPPQGKQTYTCTTRAGATGLTNKPTVTGVDPTARPVTATAEAAFVVQHPAVAITAQVTGGPFREGDAVPLRITVHNTGDVPLTGLRVTDSATPTPVAPRATGPQARATGCAQVLDGALEAGATKSFGCTLTAQADDFIAKIQVTATAPVGPPLTAEGTAAVDVIHPAIAVTGPPIRRSCAPATPSPRRSPSPTPATACCTTSPWLPRAHRHAPNPWVHSNREPRRTTAALKPPAKPTSPPSRKSPVRRHEPSRDRHRRGTGPCHPPGDHHHERCDARAGPARRHRHFHPRRHEHRRRAPDRSVHCGQSHSGVRSDHRHPPSRRSPAPLLHGKRRHRQFRELRHRKRHRSDEPPGQRHGRCGLHRHPPRAERDAGDPRRPLPPRRHRAPHDHRREHRRRPPDRRQGRLVCEDLRPPRSQASPEVRLRHDRTAGRRRDTAKATAVAPIGPPVEAEDSDALDVIHPAVKITEEAKPGTVRAGDDVTFTITVANTGDVPLTSVSVAGKEPCAKKFATLAAGEKQIYTCARKAPDDDFAETAEVTGMDPTNRSVQSTAEAKVDVVHPEIALMKDATPYEVREGATVTFSILVKNTGDVPLTAVSVVDDHTTACAHTAANLAADAEITYTCTTIAGKQGCTARRPSPARTRPAAR